MREGDEGRRGRRGGGWKERRGGEEELTGTGLMT